MDPKKHPLTVVAELLNKIRPVNGGMFCLYVQHHQLNICKCQLVPKDLPIITRITSLDVNTGLSKEMWNRVESRIRTLLKEGTIEWQPQKL